MNLSPIEWFVFGTVGGIAGVVLLMNLLAMVAR